MVKVAQLLCRHRNHREVNDAKGRRNRQALHSSRVVTLNAANPLGSEHLTAEVAPVRGEVRPQRIRRPIALSVETWQKLSDLAHSPIPGHATRTTLPNWPRPCWRRFMQRGNNRQESVRILWECNGVGGWGRFRPRI